MSDTIGALFGIMLAETEYMSRRIEAAAGIPNLNPQTTRSR
jgi:hypothetical protein